MQTEAGPSGNGPIALIEMPQPFRSRTLLSCLGVFVALLVLILVPRTASAAECTTTWTGPAEGSWATAGNWSTGKVPTSADVVCIGSGNTVNVTTGSQQAGLVQGEGSLAISGGTLTLNSTEEPSTISTLKQSGGTLTGPGDLEITSSFLWTGSNTTMSGTGKTIIKSSATLEPSSGASLTLNERTFVNNGTVTFSSGNFYVWNGGVIENNGTFKANAEHVSVDAFRRGTGSGQLIINTGTFEKTAGAGKTAVDIKFENKASVAAQSGTLAFVEGGSSSGTNSFTAAEGKKILFGGGTFSAGSSTSWSGEFEVNAATLTTSGGLKDLGSKWTVPGTGTLNVNGGPLEIGTLAVPGGTVNLGAAGTSTVSTYAPSSSGGTLTGPGDLEITSSFLWTGSNTTMSGTGKTIIKSSATLEPSSGASLTLNERTFVNNGTVTFSSGNFYVWNGGVIENNGTFKANAEHVSVDAFRRGTGSGQLIINTGTFEKTAGAGKTAVDIKFENKASVAAQSGTLAFVEGGSSSGTNSFTAAEGKKILFGGGTFSAGSSTSWSGEFEVNAATLTTSGGLKDLGSKWTVPGTGTLNVNGGPLEIGTLAVPGGTVNLGAAGTSTVSTYAPSSSGGTLTGPGDLEITSSFLWTGSNTTMSGTGKTIIKSSATLEPSSGASLTLNERTFVNNGTVTFSSGNFYVWNGGVIENNGTFKANAEHVSVDAFRRGTGSGQLIINTGTFEKTAGAGKTAVDVDFANLGVVGEKGEGSLQIKRPVHIDVETRFGKRSNCGDPVDCATGNFSETQMDIAVAGRGVGLDLTRTYSAHAAATASTPGAFGYGWTNSFSDRLVSEEGGKKITLIKGDGSTVPFTGGPGTFTAPIWSQEELTGSAESGYVLTTPNQTGYAFSGAGRLESVTDRNGNETALTYDEASRLKEITDPAGRKITLAYNGEGTVKSAEDPMGNVVEYAYESKKLQSVTLPGKESPRWQYKYDASRRITEMFDGRGGKTTNVYDGSHRVTSQTDPASRTLKFEYASFHTKVTNEATGAVSDQWFTSNNQPYSITRGFGTPDSTTEKFTYDSAGHLLSATDGNGHATTYTYDASGNRKSEKDAEGNETKWTYNGTHDVLSLTTPGGETTTIERDANGNPESISKLGPEETTQTVVFSYDELGQLESITDPLEGVWLFGHNAQGDRTAEIDPEGNVRTFEYDKNSDLEAVVSPRGNAEGAEPSKFTTSFERDPQGRPLKVTDPLGSSVEYTYDGNGNVETETNGNGHTTTYFYNAVNERTKVEKPNEAIRETEYDGAGNIISQTEPNEETTTYVRNILGQPIEIIDPLSRKTEQEFDDAGNLEAVIDADEEKTSFVYDKADQLVEVTYSDETTPNVDMDYDPDGNLTSMVDGSGESAFVYDELGRLTESENGHGDVVDYDYNVGEQLTGITYPNGKSISRTFDEVGRLEKVTDWLGGTTSFTYDADSNLEETLFPASTNNVDEYGYDRAGRMDEANFLKGGEPLAALSYIRDSAGQIENESKTGLPGAEEVAFDYDENERLIEAGEGSFEYDLADNLTKAPGTTYTYDKASQLETGTEASYTYDNLAQRVETAPSGSPATTYEYDQAGHLLSIARPEEGEVPAINQSFTYDGSGLLASQASGLTTRYLTWDLTGDLPLILNDDVNSYIYGPSGLPIAQISSEEAPTYLHHDQLGSTRLATDSSGNVSGTFSYAPYGALEGSTGETASPMGFAGQFTDAETGLQYLRARFYDPSTAQFLTIDPLAAHTHTPYLYGNANPTTFVDPSGLGACVLGFIDCDEEDDPCASPASGPMLALCLLPDEAADPVSEAAAGFGDGASHGLTQLAREGLGQSEPSDTCSLLYNFSSEFGSLFRDFTLTAWGTPALRYFPIRIKPQVPRDLPPRYQNPPRDLDPVP